jgi:hypothetical protein
MGSCLRGPCRRAIRKTSGATKKILHGLVLRIEVIGKKQPFRDDLNAEVEESPLLEAVTRERLVKTQQAGKDLPCVVTIFKVWRSAMPLKILVVPSCVYCISGQ